MPATPSGALPMPILTLGNSWLAMASMTDRTPLCPAALPPLRILTLPRGRSISS